MASVMMMNSMYLVDDPKEALESAILTELLVVVQQLVVVVLVALEALKQTKLYYMSARDSLVLVDLLAEP